MTERSGLLIIDKPAGLTSHQVVARVRRIMQTKKVGHAGTLDPMATGVLIIGVNRATRLLGQLALHDKNYLATIRLGESTNTDDAEGELTASADASGLPETQILAGMAKLTGAIMQVPAAVSAIKINGQRAYAKVRAGEKVELTARPVEVSEFELLGLKSAGSCLELDVSVTCSSGTYIRALARDLGADLGVGGHLTMLRRTRIGRYGLADAIALDELTGPDQLMTMAKAASLSFPVQQLTADQAKDVRYGRSLAIEIGTEPTALLDETGEFLALYAFDGQLARPIAVFTG